MDTTDKPGHYNDTRELVVSSDAWTLFSPKYEIWKLRNKSTWQQTIGEGGLVLYYFVKLFLVRIYFKERLNEEVKEEINQLTHVLGLTSPDQVVVSRWGDRTEITY